MGLQLLLSANLEGLTDLQPQDSEETPFEYHFEVQCTSCREIHDKQVSINRFEKHEISGSRGEANFVFKCKSCKRESSASITRTKKLYTYEDSGSNVAILDIECRGLEFTKFIPLGHFQAKGVESVTRFNEIDLSEDEFYDYDDNAGNEVSITEIKWDIVR